MEFIFGRLILCVYVKLHLKEKKIERKNSFGDRTKEGPQN